MRPELQLLANNIATGCEADMATSAWGADDGDFTLCSALSGLPSLIIPSWDSAAADVADLIHTPYTGAGLDSGAALLLGKAVGIQEECQFMQPILQPMSPHQASTSSPAQMQPLSFKGTQLVTTDMLLPVAQRSPSPCWSTSPGSTEADLPPTLEDISPFTDLTSAAWTTDTTISFSQLDAAALMGGAIDISAEVKKTTAPAPLPHQQPQQEQVLANEEPVISYLAQRCVSRRPPRVVMTRSPDPVMHAPTSVSWHDGSSGLAQSAPGDTCDESKVSTQSVGVPVYGRVSHGSSGEGYPSMQWPAASMQVMLPDATFTGMSVHDAQLGTVLRQHDAGCVHGCRIEVC